ncbi:uncharacterized protein LOC114350989 [Ostrinia furnacalis]|uniref:uncharacterized protein LOC114350989 n=1 Tax=Ostrinia furnacalis TaxID=93504 RepID=UPI001040719E|nr:uncharacterized protein LOC114350989 [Ostrinia furnacalis]XP_028157805.1 uncharacterized protein LOC114350989 [Ostrinia furnacalis]
MDRLSQLRGEAGTSRDSTLDTSSPPSESYMTANESSSKYFSLSEVDSTFDISPIKDVSLASANMESEKTMTESDQLISNLSPIGKKDFLEDYKIGKQIEAANILSGGVDIFDDNDNSYDGDELVIDDNVDVDEKSNPELKLTDTTEATLVETEAVPSKDMEVILQIDGKNVDAIDIGNGLYLYRKEGREELAAVQIIDDDQHQSNFKFLKVRENAEGNLEVYEEIQIEVPKDVPVKEEKGVSKSVPHVPIKDINKVISESTSNKITERKTQPQNISPPAVAVVKEPEEETNKEDQPEPKSGASKKMKFSDSRKSPVIGSFTPMTFHSTPNKEGIPLTKTMVDQQLHPSRHSDNIKKTIEVHTDSAKQRTVEPSGKTKDDDKNKPVLAEKNTSGDKSSVVELGLDVTDLSKDVTEVDVEKEDKMIEEKLVIDEKENELVIDIKENEILEKDDNIKLDKKLNKSEETEAKSADLSINNDKKSSEPLVVENETSKPEIEEDPKMDIIEETALLAPETKLPDVTPPPVESNVNEKCQIPELVKENENNISTSANNKDLEKVSKETVAKSDIEVTNVDSSVNNNAKNVVVDNQSSKAADEVDNILVTDNIENKTDKKINTVDITAAKEIVKDMCTDNINSKIVKKIDTNDVANTQDMVKDEKKESQATTIDATKSSSVEDSTSSVNLSTSPIPVTISKPSKVEAGIKQKEDKSDKIEKQDVTPEKKDINEPKDVKPKLPQEQNNDTQVNIDKKLANTLPSVNSDVSATLVASKGDPKVQSAATIKELKEINAQAVKPVPANTIPQTKNEPVEKKTLSKATSTTETKPINNNHAPVPFGKWTEANRQAFLNKIKETKVPTNSSNGKQIKNSNDLNRRDVLKKIDSQRQSSIASAKAQELKNDSQRQSSINTANAQDFGSANRMGVKKEAAALAVKQAVPLESRLPVKTEPPILKNSSAPVKKTITKQETIVKPQPQTETVASSAMDLKKDIQKRKEINNQDLIDKTIEEIINRPIPAKTPQEEQSQRCFDDIESQMNELHGKPFIERPIHELPPAQKLGPKTYLKPELQKANVSKPSKIPNLLPFSKTQQAGLMENTLEIDSEEEVIIEHEPITGDMDLDKKKTTKLVISEKLPVSETVTLISKDSSKKETIITETDFDKFVRRNSISYENCFTVNFDGKDPHNVIQSIVQKDVVLKTYSKIDSSNHDAKVISPRKRDLFAQNCLPNTKFSNTVNEDDGKNYQSKVKIAYQTAMTAKKKMERPIPIIEDRPVKVVYMDTNTEFISNQLNVQGKELSPAKKLPPSVESATTVTTDSLDSDNTLDSIEEEKLVDETKNKTKHQRKQVLTPVETPELELIEPDDLGIEVSPKKKRKTEAEKNTKTLVPKKSYLLGRGNTIENAPSKSFDLNKTSQRESLSHDRSHIAHKNTASAIDSLVKAAELLETQSGQIPAKAPDTPSSDSQQNTPVKRGRGRPRKNPLPEGATDKTKVPSPQKKPRLIDAKIVKSKDTDDDDWSSDDDAIVKENWTMGKINQNIVCPICNKLFRSENVVFKHVKHCSGPSPSRSDSENKNPRRLRESQESESRSYESKSDDMEIEEPDTSLKDVRKKRKSKDSQRKQNDKDEVIVIEDTPLKAKSDKREEAKQVELKKPTNKNKLPDKASNLVCEFCGKTFRQLSYLVSHKLQHGKDAKKPENESAKTNKSVFSCEVCKKEFRKLHHLAQHRLMHNPSSGSAKMSRKSSSEQSENKSKEQSTLKQSEDPSAGFRCEPCDKSFRKLHHLVEHRETHDGINRQKNTSTVQTNTEKLPAPPQCDICKKTFRKLHHLIEHKEQHTETSSEKSDDKSIKSSLSTKDIIHECSLCYMVFPNEHSLTKHTIICQRKKRQSASKQVKQSEETEVSQDQEIIKTDENKIENEDEDVTIVTDEVVIKEKPAEEIPKDQIKDKVENKTEIAEKGDVKLTTPVVLNESPIPNHEKEKKEDNKPTEPIKHNLPKAEVVPDVPVKVKKVEDKEVKPSVQDTLRKKTPSKDKVAPTVTKRHKPNLPPPVVEPELPKPAESSDDDEVRYMLNPDYKFEDNEGKLFMKVRANKRNSLQIERPNSKDLVTRRISLQHPLKVPRLKAKAVQNKVTPANPTTSKTVAKAPKLEPVPSTDSDDSDVKYSFPKNTADKVPKSNIPETSSKEPAKKIQRKSLADKRKSLSSIAKRKSLGKSVGAKLKTKPSPAKQVRKRTTEVEHRCDCGQLFSSAALLARHTTLAHTPPRVRRRRSPPPPPPPPDAKPRKSGVQAKPRPSADSRKSSVKSDVGAPKTAQPTKRKSSMKLEPKTPNEPRKSPKSSEKTDARSAPINAKLRRYAAHKGVPVPEKMRKLMEKSKK